MKETEKIWKKCTVINKLTDFTTSAHIVKEWIESISEMDFIKDIMIENKFEMGGRLTGKTVYFNDKTSVIEYDINGNEISNEVIYHDKDDQGSNIDKSKDEQGNVSEEKLEYDLKERVMKKIFFENGKADYWLEFEYDAQNRVILTRELEDGKMKFYIEHLFPSENEEIDLRYTAEGHLTLKCIYRRSNDKNIIVNSYYDENGNPLKRIEEFRNNEGNAIEQRFYDGNERLVRQIKFGENDEYGYRQYVIESEYKDQKKIKELISEYKYEY